MGQYFKIVNLDKKEYIDPSACKLWELCANNEARLLPWLLAKGPQDGTSLCRIPLFDDGEDQETHLKKIGEEASKPIGQGHLKTAGSWAGDRVVVVGDYDESGLYREVEKDGWREISAEVVREFNEFIEIERLRVGKLDYISPDMVATSAGKLHISPKIEVPIGNLHDPPSPSEQKTGPSELAEGWRRHKTHREETQAVKKALEKAGIKFRHVGHDRGTAWGWLEINLGPNPSGLEHTKQEKIPWLCAGGCPACERNQELREQVIRIAQEATGRRGDYNGEISVLMQE